MSEIIKLELSRDYVGQVLDCLQIAEEDWRRTKIYFETGYSNPQEPCIRECTNAHEAEQLEAYYHKIIAEIKKQFDKQILPP